MKAEINKIELNFEDEGTGMPIIFLHGFPFDRHLWVDQIAVLKEHCRVITPDLRGFGDSSAPDEVYSMNQYAADIITLLDILSIEQAVVVGLSMGGYIALTIAEQYPERLLGLVFSNTHSAKDTAAKRQGRYNTAEKTNYDGIGFLVDDMLEKVLSENTLKTKPDVVEYVKQMMKRQRPSGVRGALKGMAERKDRTFILSEIQAPTMVIAGENDQLIPVIRGKAMAREIPHSHLEVISDAGHLSNLEQPELYNQVLLRFVDTFKTVESD